MKQDIVNYKDTDINDYRFTISPTTIKNRLESLCLNSFVKTTNIHESLGNRSISPAIVALTVNATIPLYLSTIQINQNPYLYPNNPEFLEEHFNHIANNRIPMIKAILQDHPAAINLLIEKGFLSKVLPEQTNDESNSSATDSDSEENNSDDIYRLWDHLENHFLYSGFFPVSKYNDANYDDLEQIFSYYKDYNNYDWDERLWRAFIDNKDQ